MKPTVLVLDDEVLVSGLIEDILQEHGLCVAGPFRSNALAVDYLAHHNPNAAILDFNVADGTSGRTACRLLDLRIPFLVASGYPKTIVKGAEFQAACWLDKPFREETLVARLTELLRH